MKNSMLSHLSNLFTTNSHNKLLKICEPLIQKNPNDVDYLYCAAIAAYMTGEPEKGQMYFSNLCNLYDNFATQPEANKNVLLFLGFTALQMVDFANISKAKNINIISKLGADYALHAANTTGNNQLKKISKDLQDRIISNKNGDTFLKPISPRALQIEPTNHCNLKCTMCPHSEMTRKKGFMDIDLWEKILENWKGKGLQMSTNHMLFNNNCKLNSFGSIKLFFMGEPLLHPKIDLFIKSAKKTGCEIDTQTNEFLLKKN